MSASEEREKTNVWRRDERTQQPFIVLFFFFSFSFLKSVESFWKKRKTMNGCVFSSGFFLSSLTLWMILIWAQDDPQGHSHYPFFLLPWGSVLSSFKIRFNVRGATIISLFHSWTPSLRSPLSMSWVEEDLEVEMIGCSRLSFSGF